MGRYRLGPVYWGNDAGAYVPLAREQDKKANPELHFHRPQESIERISLTKSPSLIQIYLAITY